MVSDLIWERAGCFGLVPGRKTQCALPGLVAKHYKGQQQHVGQWEGLACSAYHDAKDAALPRASVSQLSALVARPGSSDYARFPCHGLLARSETAWGSLWALRVAHARFGWKRHALACCACYVASRNVCFVMEGWHLVRMPQRRKFSKREGQNVLEHKFDRKVV